jgi:hypothetical protein
MERRKSFAGYARNHHRVLGTNALVATSSAINHASSYPKRYNIPCTQTTPFVSKAHLIIITVLLAVNVAEGASFIGACTGIAISP